MDILFYVSWEVIVKDMCYIMDIQPSRCQVCGDEDANSTWKKDEMPLFFGQFNWSDFIGGKLTGFKVKAPVKQQTFQFPLLEAGKAFFFFF